MENTTPEPLKIICSETADRFQINFREEILQLLKKILEKRSFICAFFPDEIRSFHTILIRVDEEKNQLTFDAPFTPAIGQEVCDAGYLTMLSAVDKVRVQFVAENLTFNVASKFPTFCSAIPESLIRLQRREFYRLIAPTSPSVICEISPGVYTDSRLRLDVFDISAGGISILDIPVEETGGVIQKVNLILPDEGIVLVDLCVQNISERILPSGKVIRKVGCAFVNLSKKDRLAVQRFIFRIEGERKQRGVLFDE